MPEPRILIVEDEGIIADYIADCLETLGYEVVGTKSSGEEAIAETGSQDIDLVLMDIHIKGEMDGVEAAEEIYRQFDVPVIYLTAHADEKTLQRAKLTEPFGYILKPFEIQELRTAIEIAIHKHRIDLKVRKRERWLTMALRSVTQGVLVTDTETRILFMNSVAEQIIGWRHIESVQKPFAEICPLQDNRQRSELLSALSKVIAEGKLYSYNHHHIIDPEGKQIPIRCSIAPLHNESGGISGALIILLPDNEKSSETGTGSDGAAVMAAQAAELASLGIMASGITHEVSQPLHAILVDTNSVKFWHKRNEGVLPDKFIKKIDNISDNANRIVTILKHLDSFWTGVERVEKPMAEMNRTIEEALALIRQKASRHGIMINLAPWPESIFIEIEPSQLEQITINLIANSITALATVDTGDKWISLNLERKEDEGILKVRCNQCGRAENGTSDSDQYMLNVGIQLRLSIIKTFTEEAGGCLDIDQEQNEETVYTVRFPLTQERHEIPDENITG